MVYNIRHSRNATIIHMDTWYDFNHNNGNKSSKNCDRSHKNRAVILKHCGGGCGVESYIEYRVKDT